MVEVKEVVLAPAGAKGFSPGGTPSPGLAATAEQERLYDALKAGGVISFEWELASDAVVRSPTADEIFGYEATRDTGSAFFAQVHAEDRERLSGLLRALTPEKPAYTAVYRYIRPTDQRELVMEGAGRGVFDATGRLVRVRGLSRDITERTRAQEALRASEERYRTLVTASSQVLYRMSPDWTEMRQLEGGSFLADTDKPDRNWLQAYIHPEDQEQVLAVIRQAVSTGSVFEFEHRVRRKDGTVGWTHSRAVPMRDAQGEIVEWFGAASEVTQRKRAEEALRESEERLRLAWQATRDVIWDWDARADAQRWSGAGAEVFGWTDAVEAPQPAAWWLERVHPEDRARVTEGFHRVLDAPSLHQWQDEYRFFRSDGSIANVLDRGFVVRDGAGRPRRMVGAMQDITERKRAEETLRRSEARMAQAVQVAGLGTFEHDHQTDVIEHSAVMRQLMGFAAGEEITIPGILEKVVPEDRDRLAASIRRAHDPGGEGIFEVEYRVAGPEGRSRWVSARSQTFFEGQGSERRAVQTIGAALDVTERKEAQAQLERLVAERTAKLQELVGELEHFSYTITHDLKSPLRAMRGFAEMAAQLCEEGGLKRPKELLEKISTSADRMDSLIRDALNYNRAVRQELPLEDVDTGVLLRGMLDSYPELQASRANIQLEGKMPVVLGNAAALTQCFSNLLGNAVKFVQPGQRPQVRVWAEQREGWARIWVEDKGIGISKEMLARVFDMFSRGSKGYEGTGIGLALVRKVTQRMGGRAGVESEEGKGSRFWLELKAGEMQEGPQPEWWASSEPASGTVLYVEDEENDALFMQRAFAEKGLASALQVVGDGRAAIDYLSGAGKYGERRDHPLPTVVLLDLNLPQMPGFEVLRWMRNHPDFAATPVVVFTSSTREDDRLKARQLGANEFVAKPKSGMDFGVVVEMLRQKWLGAAVA